VFGLDHQLAGLSDGTTTLLVVVVAITLGLRHASDPDHLAAVSTLIASGKERATRDAARLGLAWGLGHGTTLFMFGLPVVLYSAYLPDRVQSWAETSVGVLIVVLALLLLGRWRRGAFHGAHSLRTAHRRRHRRTGRRAYCIGLLHGMGGTAGVGLLLLGGIHSEIVAVVALWLFAFFTAISMTLLSTGWGALLCSSAAQRSFQKVAPAIGVSSLAFGVWYALGAQGIVPYVL
jgi:high-affinity nickel permease